MMRRYDQFKFVDNTYYALNVSGFRVGGEWGLRDDLSRLNGKPFVTKDFDDGGNLVDEKNCVIQTQSAGWSEKPQ
jgi:hypothetical protein